MKFIMSKNELKELAKQIGVRNDWHEPDEQDVDARVEIGTGFDNACGSDMSVIISKDGVDVFKINLATLFAFACDTYNGEE